MIYRPEIDGLRAVAVVSVILFHAGVPALSGGFVGVDVFFVISGFLITAIILAEIEKGQFSILRFYERRARRIMPALVLVLLACLPFAWAWMRPDQLTSFAKSLVAVVFFASNILFWRESGYFDTDTAEKPLLHTWSLAVEEQFYLFFPLILIVVWRMAPRRLLPVILAMGAASLALSEWSSYRWPGTNFYMLHTRAWELLAGSVCAVLLAGRNRPGQELPAAAGLILIAGSILFYTEHMRFPGLSAVPVVLGTALVIFFGSGTRTGRLLAWPPFVGIGLISYSAYLWHQPLFAFARIRSVGAPTLTLMLGLSLAAFVLAWLSWRYVEAPFRRGSASLLPRRPALFGATALASLAILGIGMAGYLARGFPGRIHYSPLQESYFATSQPSPKRDECHQLGPEIIPVDQSCTLSGEPARVAVFGNSHAVELAYGLAQELHDHGMGGVRQFSFSGCEPIYESGDFSSPCAQWTRETLDYIAADPTLTHVVVSYRATSSIRTRDGEAARPTAEALGQILAELQRSKKVIFAMQAPELPAPVAKVIQFSSPDANPLPGVSAATWAERRRGFDRLALPLIDPAIVFETPRLFCDDQACIAGRDGTSFYFDDDHMSVEGARMVARALLPLLKNDGPAPAATPRDSEKNQKVAAHQTGTTRLRRD